MKRILRAYYLTNAVLMYKEKRDGCLQSCASPSLKLEEKDGFITLYHIFDRTVNRINKLIS